MTTTTTTDSQRARTRARESRLRAICEKPGQRYTVRNLKTGKKYTVWYNVQGSYPGWECTCPTNNRKQRCKHVQRVMDREERRVRREALCE